MITQLQDGRQQYLCEVYLPEFNVATILTQSSQETTNSGAELIHQDLSIRFENSNCQGTAYMTGIDGISDFMVMFGNGNEARYFYGTLPKVQNIECRSSLSRNGVCSSHNPPTLVLNAMPATEIKSEDLPFSIPLKLPLRYEMQ
jgi:hypothetical protein